MKVLDHRAPLARLREARGLTQRELAELVGLKHAGSLSAIESGSERPSLRTALKIQLWSAGEVPAESLLSPEDAQLLREAIAAGRAPACEGVAA